MGRVLEHDTRRGHPDGLVTAAIASAGGALGVYLLYTAFAFGWRNVGPEHVVTGRAARDRVQVWLVQAGLADVAPAQFLSAVLLVGAMGGATGYLFFGGPVPAGAAAFMAGLVPVAAYRSRRVRLLEEAREAWPRMLEEIRLQAGGLGRSIPQALFEVGRRGPEVMRIAFGHAEQEWLVTTDLRRALETLKARLADPTADVVCETLLVAHEVGSGNLDRHLRALVEDRLLELDGRRDALAKQAGARFARRFVLLVPLGMAAAGLAIGDGRASYATPSGQLAVGAGVAALVLCWVWAGRIMRLPEAERVFGSSVASPGAR